MIDLKHRLGLKQGLARIQELYGDLKNGKDDFGSERAFILRTPKTTARSNGFDRRLVSGQFQTANDEKKDRKDKKHEMLEMKKSILFRSFPIYLPRIWIYCANQYVKRLHVTPSRSLSKRQTATHTHTQNINGIDNVIYITAAYFIIIQSNPSIDRPTLYRPIVRA